MAATNPMDGSYSLVYEDMRSFGKGADPPGIPPMETAAVTKPDVCAHVPIPPAKELWQVKQFEHWIKTVLIYQLMKPGQNVCDVTARAGEDLGKWEKKQPGGYIGVDSNEDFVRKAEAKYNEKKYSYRAAFIHCDPLRQSLDEILELGIFFDVVFSNCGLAACFDNPVSASNYMYNVCSRLVPGGYFFGIVPDSSAIWTKSQKAFERTKSTKISEPLFEISFDSDDFEAFGSKYTLRIGGVDIHSYLVHNPTLIKVAEDFGLRLVEMTNFLDFWETHRKHYPELVTAYKVLHKKVDTCPHPAGEIAEEPIPAPYDQHQYDSPAVIGGSERPVEPSLVANPVGEQHHQIYYQ